MGIIETIKGELHNIGLDLVMVFDEQSEPSLVNIEIHRVNGQKDEK